MVIQETKNSIPVRTDKEERPDGMGSIHHGDGPIGVFDLGV